MREQLEIAFSDILLLNNRCKEIAQRGIGYKDLLFKVLFNTKICRESGDSAMSLRRSIYPPHRGARAGVSLRSLRSQSPGIHRSFDLRRPYKNINVCI
jgi:hypothetical protein